MCFDFQDETRSRYVLYAAALGDGGPRRTTVGPPTGRAWRHEGPETAAKRFCKLACGERQPRTCLSSIKAVLVAHAKLTRPRRIEWQTWTNLVQSALDANRPDIVEQLTAMMDKYVANITAQLLSVTGRADASTTSTYACTNVHVTWHDTTVGKESR